MAGTCAKVALPLMIPKIVPRDMISPRSLSYETLDYLYYLMCIVRHSLLQSTNQTNITSLLCAACASREVEITFRTAA